VKLSAEQRLSILECWEKARKAGPLLGASPGKIDEQMEIVLEARGTPFNIASLYRWRSLYASKGIQGLIDGRSLRGPIDRSSDQFLQEARRLRAASGIPLSVAECQRLACEAAKRNGWKRHGIWTTKRYLRSVGLGGQRANRWHSMGGQRPFEGH
jgi:hypothetical protein